MMKIQVDDIYYYVDVEVFKHLGNCYIISWKPESASFTDPPNQIFVENLFPYEIERINAIYDMLLLVIRSGRHKVIFNGVDDYLSFIKEIGG